MFYKKIEIVFSCKTYFNDLNFIYIFFSFTVCLCMADNMHHIFVLMVKLCNGQTGWTFHMRFKYRNVKFRPFCFFEYTYLNIWSFTTYSDLYTCIGQETCVHGEFK